MPYLDNSPAPGDNAAAEPHEGQTHVSVPIDEPEEMIGRLLQFICDATGRRVVSFDVEWASFAELETGERFVPSSVRVVSQTALPFRPNGGNLSGGNNG